MKPTRPAICSIFEDGAVISWFRKKLGLHVHEWRHHSTFQSPGYSIEHDGILHTLLPRTIYYRECWGCGAVKTYYPTTPPQEPADD